MKDSLDMPTALIAFEKIQLSKLDSLRNQLMAAAIRYAHIRAEWKSLSAEERLSADPERTAAHNRFIDACNILSRNQVSAGEDASWHKTIGSDRKMIGDFACWIHAFVAISYR